MFLFLNIGKPQTYKQRIGNCLLKLQIITLNALKMRDYLRDLIIWVHPLISMVVITWVKRPRLR